MPILVDLRHADDDLGQGDLLDAVRLFQSSSEGMADLIPKVSRALVISRDCAAVNKDYVVVAPVEAGKLDLDRIEDCEKAYDALKRHVAHLRDGGARPDRFYLGSWGDEPLRMTAHLDRLCALALPNEVEARRTWVGKHRIARLSEDFLRALPVRMFWAFGRVGFDDVAWYPTQDLRAVVAAGEAWLHELQSRRATAELQLQTASTGESKRDASLTATRDKAEAEVAKVVAEVSMLREELRRR